LLAIAAIVFSACGAPTKIDVSTNESVADLNASDLNVSGLQEGQSRQAKTIVISAVGDIMLGTDYPNASTLPPDDGKAIFEQVAPILLSADIAIGNLESAMIDGGSTDKCKRGSPRCFTFRTPTRYAARLKEAGFDAMNIANNHSNDFGIDGAASSIRALDEQNISHTGLIGDIARLIANDLHISIIGFAPNSKYQHDINDLNLTQKLVALEKQKADIVVAFFHGGAEGGDKTRTPKESEFHLGENRGDLMAFARTAIDAGADLVIGSGPHVPRGLEIYKNRLIAYSLGNFATWEMMNLSGFRALAPILEVTLRGDGTFTKGRIYSAIQIKPGAPRIDPTNAAFNLMRDLSIEDFGENAPVFGENGEILPIHAAQNKSGD
jgi:poly-gamma-glutamate capsule biosynthesis protein CapA/YwtB (metallophosphatase superfamily)